jgi:Uma2 family endonuclease
MLLNKGFYNIVEFKDHEKIVYMTFPELVLTVEQILSP